MKLKNFWKAVDDKIDSKDHRTFRHAITWGSLIIIAALISQCQGW